jgi:AcrR family transcriptional regulator
VAREAGMVPGNLYRYFPSKDAMIAGLAERDRLEIAADFASLSGAPDFLEAFKALGRKYFLEEPREKAIIALEIWVIFTHFKLFH